MQQKSRRHAAVTLALGVLLLLVGIFFLFAPGPGLVPIFFGTALVATHSQRLSRLLDRVEPRLHVAVHRLHAWWVRRAYASKALIIVGALAPIGVGGYALWRFMVSPYLS